MRVAVYPTVIGKSCPSDGDIFEQRPKRNKNVSNSAVYGSTLQQR